MKSWGISTCIEIPGSTIQMETWNFSGRSDWTCSSIPPPWGLSKVSRSSSFWHRFGRHRCIHLFGKQESAILKIYFTDFFRRSRQLLWRPSLRLIEGGWSAMIHCCVYGRQKSRKLTNRSKPGDRWSSHRGGSHHGRSLLAAEWHLAGSKNIFSFLCYFWHLAGNRKEIKTFIGKYFIKIYRERPGQA